MESVAVILGVGTKGLPKFRFRHCRVDILHPLQKLLSENGLKAAVSGNSKG
jgi:hypothetical protein